LEEQTTPKIPSDTTRSRIIEATFHLLMESGYAAATTSEIARRARVSKRELYALFDSKEGILAAMIAGRAARMRQPLALPEAADRAGLAQTLTLFGVSLLREGSNPAVMAIMRLAIAEADRAPDLARRLDEDGRKPTRAALTDFLRRAGERGLIGGADAEIIAGRFFALLWGDLQLALLLRRAEPPSAEEAESRAKAAVAAVLALYEEPISRAL
jgi:AcrR family transcriptional regulator